MRETMRVVVERKETSQPIIHEDIDNTYIKGGFYCLVNRQRNLVFKYPVADLFRVIEPYRVAEAK